MPIPKKHLDKNRVSVGRASPTRQIDVEETIPIDGGVTCGMGFPAASLISNASRNGGSDSLLVNTTQPLQPLFRVTIYGSTALSHVDLRYQCVGHAGKNFDRDHAIHVATAVGLTWTHEVQIFKYQF